MMERVKASETWIQEALEKFEGPLIRYARQIVGDVERARDVVQETFLRLCKQNATEPPPHLAEWLYTVCRNCALDVRRKERRMTTMDQAVVNGRPAEGLDPAAECERKDLAAGVLSMVGALPENQQEVLRLKFQGGLSYREISHITGFSESNVGFLLHVGLRTIRQRLANPATVSG